MTSFGLLILWFLSVGLLPETGICREGAAGRAGAFLRMGLGARGRAMGNAQTAAVQDGYAAYYNPAALPDLQQRTFTASKMFLSLDRSFNVVGYAQQLPPTAGLSLLWINAGVGGIDERDLDGNNLGAVDYSENALYFSFANRVSRYVSFGVSGKFLYQRLYEISAKGFGADIGILATPRENLQIGLQVKDIRSSYDWNTNDIYERGSSIENRFPVVFRGGAAYTIPAYNTVIAVDVDKERHGDTYLHVGVEHAIRQRYALRAGFDGGDLGGGIGLIIPFAGLESIFDYSVVHVSHDPELSQILSWVVKF